MSKIPLDALEPAKRIQALKWMEHGVHAGIKRMCENRAHQIFVQSLHGGPPFDPASVWDSFGDNTHEHFDHGADALATIAAKIAEAELEIAQPAPPAEPAPPDPPVEETRTKKPATKKRPKKGVKR